MKILAKCVLPENEKDVKELVEFIKKSEKFDIMRCQEPDHSTYIGNRCYLKTDTYSYIIKKENS
jgi:hypothetical protein